MGMEALLRWKHPERGMVDPNDFIPLAEETGLIVPIGQWVMRTACTQAKLWSDQGYGDLRVAVNLSLRQFQEFDLIPCTAEILCETGIDPTVLELEITESTAMEGADMKIAILRRLKALGSSLLLTISGPATCR